MACKPHSLKYEDTFWPMAIRHMKSEKTPDDQWGVDWHTNLHAVRQCTLGWATNFEKANFVSSI